MKAPAERKIYITGGFLFITLIVLALIIRNTSESGRFASLENIIRRGKLRVVSENSSTGISRNGNEISGFQYEILKIFADSLGLELEIAMENDLRRCIRALNAGRYDLIAKYIPVTTEWRSSVSFTTPLLVSRQMLVQRIDETTNQGKIKHLYQLAGDSVFIPKNSPHLMRLKHLSDEIADTVYIIEAGDTNQEELTAWVAEGKIKSTICNEQLTRKLSRKYQNIDVSVPVSLAQPYGWIVNKESEALLNELDDFLSRFIGSNLYWKLYREYY